MIAQGRSATPKPTAQPTAQPTSELTSSEPAQEPALEKPLMGKKSIEGLFQLLAFANGSAKTPDIQPIEIDEPESGVQEPQPALEKPLMGKKSAEGLFQLLAFANGSVTTPDVASDKDCGVEVKCKNFELEYYNYSFIRKTRITYFMRINDVV